MTRSPASALLPLLAGLALGAGGVLAVRHSAAPRPA